MAAGLSRMAAAARQLLGARKRAVSSPEHVWAPQQDANAPSDGEESADTAGETSPLVGDARCQTWREPGRNTYRLATCFLSFFLMGANDSSYGALIPYLEDYYHVNHASVSLVYLSPTAGYMTAAVSNHYWHTKLGQRGVAVIAGLCHVVAYAIMAAHPRFAYLVMGYVFVGFGNGIIDSGWNAWASSLRNPSQILGWLHALYSTGGILGPLIVTALITKANLQWYTFGYFMIALSAAEVTLMSWAFWDFTATRYRQVHRQDANRPETGFYAAIFQAPSARICWVAALFFLVYVGVEVALGGWIVTFMLDERHAARFASGMVSVGFWSGITVGRVILGYMTGRLGVQTSTTLYIVSAAAALIVFWMVPVFYVTAVAVAVVGFFLGPMYPNTVLVVNRLLPSQLHVAVIGFTTAVGGCGAAVMPFLTGLLAEYAEGVKVLPIIMLVLLGILFVVWNCFPKIQKDAEE